MITVITGADTINTIASAPMVTASARMLTAEPAQSSNAISDVRVMGSINDADRRLTWNR